MTEFQALILGIVQGLTEFFPVSSSGHLVLGQTLFGIDGNVLQFDILVHLGSLFAVMIVFRRAIADLSIGTLQGLGEILSRKQSTSEIYRSSPAFRTVTAIIVGTIPAVIIGFSFQDGIEKLFHSAGSVFLAMGFTGCVLLGTFLTRNGTRQVGIMNGILIGLAQALAIAPGISRSGMTIASGLFAGVRRETAGEFSFLLSIPVILGATALGMKDMLAPGMSPLTAMPTGVMAVGMVSAFLSGWAALVLLMGVVRRGKIGYFGFYCLAVSIAGSMLWAHAG